MKKKLFILTSVLFMGVACENDDHTIDPTPLTIGTTGDSLLIPNMEKIIDDYTIPAIASMTMKSGQILEKGEVGSRISDSMDEVKENSKWHIGSITKSMTATLTGILIDKGFLKWETTIGEVASEGYLPEYQNITIRQLLSHTGGVTPEDYPVDPSDTRSTQEIRLEWAIAALNQPQGQVGTFDYSNSSYVVVGVMLELIMDSSWEDLIVEHLFEPLGMQDTGFGAPGKSDDAEQPWGHRLTSDDWAAKDPADVRSDNPAALGPGGTVHTTLNNIAKYASLHLGKTDLIKSETLQALHTEVYDSGYALGWNVTENGIFHSGSNSYWFAQLLINLEHEFVNFAVTNSYDLEQKKSSLAVGEMMGIMGERYANSQ